MERETAKPGRFERVSPDTEQQAKLADIRALFEELEIELVSRVPEGRYRSLYLTALEEAAMWASKAVTHG